MFAFKWPALLEDTNLVTCWLSSTLTPAIMDSWSLHVSATPQVACWCFGSEVSVQLTTCLSSRAEGARRNRWEAAAVTPRVHVMMWRREVVCCMMTPRPWWPQANPISWALVVLKEVMTHGEMIQSQLPFVGVWGSTASFFLQQHFMTHCFLLQMSGKNPRIWDLLFSSRLH